MIIILFVLPILVFFFVIFNYCHLDVCLFKASEAGADKIAPFRQQAAAVTSIKRNALEKLEKAKAEYDVVAAKLQEKKEAAKHLIGEPFLKDDELKRYAARLKSKNVSYKRAKAELDGLRAENGVLSRTQAILDNQVAYYHIDSRYVTSSVIKKEKKLLMT